MRSSPIGWVAAIAVLLTTADAASASAASRSSCDSNGIGALQLEERGARITSVGIGVAREDDATPRTSTAVDSGVVATAVPYCLVKVLVPQAINIWVALPMEGRWNGRLQAEGSGGFAGIVGVAVQSVLGGYVGVQSDTGHIFDYRRDGKPYVGPEAGAFALRADGTPNVQLREDFAFRSEHLMATVGRQVARAFYGRDPAYSYWNGCSTGGRQGLRMAQDFPRDYDGILAGAPAINWDRLQPFQMWPQVIMKALAGGPIASAKQELASRAALASCDALDGVTDGVITNPAACRYSARADLRLTKASCARTDDTCLSPNEASAIDQIWGGAIDSRGRLLWPGLERGAPLGNLAGPQPGPIAIGQARYWVFHDPTWDWRSVTLENYEQFFKSTVEKVGPLMASSNPDLSAFDARGGKILAWHGLNDQAIVPRGTIMYYEKVVQTLGGEYADTQEFFRLFMAPGVEHCGLGPGPQPRGMFEALVKWVENRQPPQQVESSQALPNGQMRTRPLCPYPAFAQYTGHGDTNDARNFTCNTPLRTDRLDLNPKVAQHLDGE